MSAVALRPLLPLLLLLLLMCAAVSATAPAEPVDSSATGAATGIADGAGADTADDAATGVCGGGGGDCDVSGTPWPSAPSTSWCPAAQPLLFPHTPPGVLQATMLTNPATLRIARRLSLAVEKGMQVLTVAVPESKVFQPDSPMLQLDSWRAWHKLLKDKTERAIKKNRLYSVMNKPNAAPGADSKHHYFSVAPYWWPDPGSPTGLPYIQIDGARNPERDAIPDQREWTAMVRDVHVLAMAWSFLGDEIAAQRAVLLLSVWFLEPATAMEPHMEHAQVRRGNNNDVGHYTGLLDIQKIVELLDSVTLLLDSPAASSAFQQDLRAWFGRYLDWLLSDSPVMAGLATAEGNHASWGALQICGIAAFLGRADVVSARIMDYVQRVLPLQITHEGAQPLEEVRPDSWHYVNYNLEAALQLATLSQNFAAYLRYTNNSQAPFLPDLFQCVSSVGGNSSLLGAINQLVPFVARAGGADIRLWYVSHVQQLPIEVKDVVLPLELLSLAWDHPLYHRPDARLAQRFGGLRYSHAYTAVSEAIAPTIIGESADLAWVKRVPPRWLKSAEEIDAAMRQALIDEEQNRLRELAASSTASDFIGVKPKKDGSTAAADTDDGDLLPSSGQAAVSTHSRGVDRPSVRAAFVAVITTAALLAWTD